MTLWIRLLRFKTVVPSFTFIIREISAPKPIIRMPSQFTRGSAIWVSRSRRVLDNTFAPGQLREEQKSLWSLHTDPRKKQLCDVSSMLLVDDFTGGLCLAVFAIIHYGTRIFRSILGGLTGQRSAD